ncbi:MAG: efflux RND transporter permease subunit [Bacteroidota bacterium]
MNRSSSHFSVTLGFLSLAVIGYLLLPRLSVRWEPSFPQKQLSLSYAWPEADPQLLEQQLTAPLEAALALIPGITEIQSTSRMGNGLIQLEIDPAVDGQFIRFQVAAQVRRLYASLPAGITYPQLSYSSTEENNDYNSPLQIYSLSGPDDPTRMYEYAAQQLVPLLSLLPGLERVEVTGGNQLHWKIKIDPNQAAISGQSIPQLTERLSTHWRRQGLGLLQWGDDQHYTYFDNRPLSSPHRFSPEDWQTIPLPDSSQLRSLQLGDIAQLSQLPLPPRRFYRVNGQNSLRLLLYPIRTANQLELAERLGEKLAGLKNELPQGYRLRLESDSTERLREEVRKNKKRTALSMGILCLFLLLVYRSWRQLLIISFGLLINLGLAFLLYYWLAVEINLYAFAAIAVSFGIMIDNLIVVLDRLRHTVASAVSPALVGATLTTLASLSVIWFLSEEIRVQLFELARVMIINLGCSLLVALVLMPALVGHFRPRQGHKSVGKAWTRGSTKRKIRLIRLHYQILQFLVGRRKLVWLSMLLLFGLPVFWLPNKVSGWEWYNTTIGSDTYRQVYRPQVNKWLGGSFRLFSNYVYEGSGYRRPEQTQLYVEAALPEGATLEQLNKVLLSVEGYLAGFTNQLENYRTSVSSGQQGRITLSFPADVRPGFPEVLKNRLTAYAVNFGGVSWNIYGVGQGFSNSGFGSPLEYRVQLRAYNQAGLDQQATRLAELLAQHPRVKDINTNANINWWEKDRSEYLLTYQPDRLAQYGLDLNDFRQALDWFDQRKFPQFYLSNGQGVTVASAQADNYDRWRMENWSIPLNDRAFQFRQLASLEKRQAPQALHKIDQQYLRQIEYKYQGSSRFGSRHLDACLDSLKAELPLGFSVQRDWGNYSPPGQEWSWSVGLAILFIFFICALLFESLRQAFQVILLIPLSFIGIFLTFYYAGLRLDQGGYTSFLLVTGLVVNGLILIINEYNYLRKQRPHWNSLRLYLRAFHRKITPIALTIFSTSAGLIPFLIGGKQEVFWPGLAAGTIGGLVFSFFLLTLIAPTFFVIESKKIN